MELNPEQSAAVATSATNAVVIASAGSGKTRSLIGRIRFLIETGTDAGLIVAITFTNAAASELQSRLPDLRLGFCGTIHAYCLQLLTRGGHQFNLPAQFAVLSQEQSEQLLAEVIADLRLKKVPVSRVRESLRTEGVMGGWDLIGERLINFEYHSRLLRGGMLTFDAILHFTARLIPLLAEQLASVALLVDEYQDVSPLIHKICTELPTASKWFCGDVDQAIFGFNGASPAGMLSLVHNPEWQTYVLSSNYRCGPAICEAANKLIAHNRARVPKVMVSAATDERAWISQRIFDDQETETRYIVSVLNKIPKDRTTAVLCRTNFAVAEMAAAIRAAGIPVAERKLIERPSDWPAVRAWLAWQASPDNDWLAEQVLSETRSEAEARALRMGAQQQMTSLRKHAAMKVAADIQELPQLAARHFCAASCELLEKLIAGKTGSVTDLALWESEALGEEIGAGTVVTTCHSAKGREFDVVFIPCVVDRVVTADIEEERRLLFVAITRAREGVFLSAPTMGRSGSWQRRPEPMKPSRFLEEVQ